VIEFKVQIESPKAGDVRAILQRHFELMRAISPAESFHVMAPDSLLEADVILMGARQEGHLLAIGGLKVIALDHTELKSMRTLEAVRGQGAGRKVLQALIKQAGTMGLQAVSLETGSEGSFEPARQLYQSHGFKECPPFGAYAEDPLSVFMTRVI
jgi:putative acetyltransferase